MIGTPRVELRVAESMIPRARLGDIYRVEANGTPGAGTHRMMVQSRYRDVFNRWLLLLVGVPA